MTFLDPYRDGHHHRPAYLRPLPSLRALPEMRLIQGGQPTPPYTCRDPYETDGLDALIHAVTGDPDGVQTEIPGEHGVLIRNCDLCSDTHHTLWDRIRIARAHLPHENRDVYAAYWPCPIDGRDIELIVPGDVFADAVESGAEITPEVEVVQEFERIVARHRHPGNGSWAPDGSDAA